MEETPASFKQDAVQFLNRIRAAEAFSFFRFRSPRQMAKRVYPPPPPESPVFSIVYRDFAGPAKERRSACLRAERACEAVFYGGEAADRIAADACRRSGRGAP